MYIIIKLCLSKANNGRSSHRIHIIMRYFLRCNLIKDILSGLFNIYYKSNIDYSVLQTNSGEAVFSN